MGTNLCLNFLSIDDDSNILCLLFIQIKSPTFFYLNLLLHQNLLHVRFGFVLKPNESIICNYKFSFRGMFQLTVVEYETDA